MTDPTADQAAAAVREVGEQLGQLVALAGTGDMPSLVAEVVQIDPERVPALLVTALHLLAQRDVAPATSRLTVVDLSR